MELWICKKIIYKRNWKEALAKLENWETLTVGGFSYDCGYIIILNICPFLHLSLYALLCFV